MYIHMCIPPPFPHTHTHTHTHTWGGEQICPDAQLNMRAHTHTHTDLDIHLDTYTSGHTCTPPPPPIHTHMHTQTQLLSYTYTLWVRRTVSHLHLLERSTHTIPVSVFPTPGSIVTLWPKKLVSKRVNKCFCFEFDTVVVCVCM